MQGFKQFFESFVAPYHCLFGVYCFSQGWRGDHEDIPAGDPKKSQVRWYLPSMQDHEDPLKEQVIAQLDPLLAGTEVVLVENPSTGSFHERWINLYAFIKGLTERQREVADEIDAGLWSWDGVGKFNRNGTENPPMRGCKFVGQFPYTSLHDAVQAAVKHWNVRPPKRMPMQHVAQPNIPHTNLDRDQYYRREIEKRTTARGTTRRDLEGE